MEVVFVDACWDQMFELQDLVIDSFTAAAFDGRM